MGGVEINSISYDNMNVPIINNNRKGKVGFLCDLNATDCDVKYLEHAFITIIYH